jgi:hypothetical protein
MTRLAVKDALLDAQLLRTAGSAPYDGADQGGKKWLPWPRRRILAV